MTTEQVRQLHRARPFRPFMIQLADGREIFVMHNEFLSIAPSGRTIIVHQPDDSFRSLVGKSVNIVHTFDKRLSDKMYSGDWRVVSQFDRHWVAGRSIGLQPGALSCMVLH